MYNYINREFHRYPQKDGQTILVLMRTSSLSFNNLQFLISGTISRPTATNSPIEILGVGRGISCRWNCQQKQGKNTTQSC